MAVERRLLDEPPIVAEGPTMDIEIDIEDDGLDGVVVDFDEGAPEEGATVDHDDNLAEWIDEDELTRIGSDLVALYDQDKNSRRDWEDALQKGLKELGVKIEDRSEPWEGACGVIHPLMAEAIVRFQSQTILEIMPPSGPVRTKIVGKITPEREKQADRIEKYLNYMITEEMREYREEVEKQLFGLALAGSAFKKIYWDQNLNRPVSMYVPAEDLVMNYGSTSARAAERMTHRLKRSKNEVRRAQVDGFYRDVDLGDPVADYDNMDKEKDGTTGRSPSIQSDNRYTLLEMQVEYDLPGFEHTDEDGEPTGISLPYIITVDKGTGKVLSIYRNWEEGDDRQKPVQHIVQYDYIPGIGAYGFGLTHLVGGIARSATSLLRQLVDAGTLANIPGGLKARGLRIFGGDDLPIAPGEFRDVDVPAGAIKDNILPLPYKEPSATLHALLGDIVEEGRRFASLTDLKISENHNAETPVGTTLALLERSLKVMTAVHARIYASMKDELRLIAKLVQKHGPENYPYDLEGDEGLKPEDFDDRIDVIPVSDPNASTMAQRIMQHQAALQLAQSDPTLYDRRKLHRKMLATLGIDDVEDVLPLEEDLKPMDPVSENMAMLKGEPIKAFLYQDHQSHIKVHMMAAQDPKMLEIVSQSPTADATGAAFAAHVIEHLAYEYRKQIEQEMGVELPPVGEPLPEDIEVRLSKLVAEAADQLFNKHAQEQQAKEIVEKLEDPIIQQNERKLDIQEKEAMAKAQKDAAAIEQKYAALIEQRRARDADRQSREKIAAAEITQRELDSIRENEQKDKDRSSKELETGTRAGLDIGKAIMEQNAPKKPRNE